MGDIGVERREVVFEPAVVAPDPEPAGEPLRPEAPAPQPAPLP
jgi:hypothetical protein